MAELILLTGAMGAGKTTLCRSLVDLARRRGKRTAGVISPPVFEDGVKIAIDVEDLSSGERRKLARLPREADSMEGVRTDGWVFEGGGLDWASEVLRNVKDCDLLVVDELGPLELLWGQGWQAGITVLDEGAYRLALAVVRPELLGDALKRWPEATVADVGDAAQVAALVERLERRFLDNPAGMHL